MQKFNNQNHPESRRQVNTHSNHAKRVASMEIHPSEFIDELEIDRGVLRRMLVTAFQEYIACLMKPSNFGELLDIKDADHRLRVVQHFARGVNFASKPFTIESVDSSQC